jgi:hypothetical protein
MNKFTETPQPATENDVEMAHKLTGSRAAAMITLGNLDERWILKRPFAGEIYMWSQDGKRITFGHGLTSRSREVDPQYPGRAL